MLSNLEIRECINDYFESDAPVVKSWLNARCFPKDYEVNVLPHLTVPDQSMTVREILDRYAKGLPLGGAKVPMYDEDEELPDPRKLDLADRERLMEEYAEELRIFRENEEKKREESRKKREEDDFNKRMNLELQKRKNYENKKNQITEADGD